MNSGVISLRLSQPSVMWKCVLLFGLKKRSIKRGFTLIVFVSDMPMDVHNDLFLSASLIGEAMQSMVTTVSRKTGNEPSLDIC